MKDDRLVAMRVFQATVAAGGFTAAAQSLGVSQPFVSQTIQRLEARLGATLLHRTTRGHRLTPEGERYLAACKAALDAVDLADASLQLSAQTISGPLRVSAPVAFGLDRVVPALPRFLNRHPGVSLDLTVTDDHVNLIDERVDVAIRMGMLADSSLVGRRLCRLTRVVVAAPSLLARHGAPETPQDLARLPSLTWGGAREHLNRWSFIVGDAVHTHHAVGRFQANSGMALFEMCKAGFGVMRCAEHLASPAIRDGVLMPLLTGYRSPDDGAFYALYLPDRNLLPRIRTFIDFLIDLFHEPEW